MIETKAINPTTCSNCRMKIKIGNTFYRGGRLLEPHALCPACYEKREGFIAREKDKGK